MAEQRDPDAALTGSGNQKALGLLHPVQMAVGHIDLHSAHRFHQRLGRIHRHTVMIAVAGNAVKADVGIFFLHRLGVIIMISQMDHHIGPHPLDAQSHKAQGTMGIR